MPATDMGNWPSDQQSRVAQEFISKVEKTPDWKWTDAKSGRYYNCWELIGSSKEARISIYAAIGPAEVNSECGYWAPFLIRLVVDSKKYEYKGTQFRGLISLAKWLVDIERKLAGEIEKREIEVQKRISQKRRQQREQEANVLISALQR